MRPGTCGFTVTAPLYFVSFFMLSNYIMMNLIVAIILDNYDLNRNLSTCIVNRRHDESFRKNWKIFDGDGDGMIPAHNLHALIMKTLYPLGLGNEPEGMTERALRKAARQIELELELPCHEPKGEIAFEETLNALTLRAIPVEELDARQMGVVQGELRGAVAKRGTLVKRLELEHGGEAAGKKGRRGSAGARVMIAMPDKHEHSENSMRVLRDNDLEGPGEGVGRSGSSRALAGWTVREHLAITMVQSNWRGKKGRRQVVKAKMLAMGRISSSVRTLVQRNESSVRCMDFGVSATQKGAAAVGGGGGGGGGGGAGAGKAIGEEGEGGEKDNLKVETARAATSTLTSTPPHGDQQSSPDSSPGGSPKITLPTLSSRKAPAATDG